MTQDAMVTLCAASADEIAALAAQMAPLRNGEPMPWLMEGVKNGHYEITTICRDGKPSAAVWTWFSAGNKSLVVNAAGSLCPGADVSQTLVAGLMVKAHQCGATSISFETARRGLIQKMRQHGFQVEGVVMRKVL